MRKSKKIKFNMNEVKNLVKKGQITKNVTSSSLGELKHKNTTYYFTYTQDRATLNMNDEVIFFDFRISQPYAHRAANIIKITDNESLVLYTGNGFQSPNGKGTVTDEPPSNPANVMVILHTGNSITEISKNGYTDLQPLEVINVQGISFHHVDGLWSFEE